MPAAVNVSFDTPIKRLTKSHKSHTYKKRQNLPHNLIPPPYPIWIGSVIVHTESFGEYSPYNLIVV